MIVFVDSLRISVLIRLAGLGKSVRSIYHFDPIPSFTRKVVRILSPFGLICEKIRQVEHHVGQIKNDKGETQYHELWSSVRSVCEEIIGEQISRDPLIALMERRWSRSKVGLHMERIIEHYLRDECFRVHLVMWIVKSHLNIPIQQTILMIRRTKWVKYVALHASSFGLRLMSYPDRIGTLVRTSWGVAERVGKLMGGVGRKVKRSIGRRTIAAAGREAGSPGSLGRGRNPGKVAVRYWSRPLSINPRMQSEIFWVKDCGIPPGYVLVYDYSGKRAIEEEERRELFARRIEVFGRHKDARVWSPTPGMILTVLSIFRDLCHCVLICLKRREEISSFILYQMVALGIDYAYWLDFYRTNGICVNVSYIYNLKTSQVLAMDSLGGVTVSYQYAVSIIFLAASYLSCGEDVQFVFSSKFWKLWEEIGAPVKCLINSGPINHNVINLLRGEGRYLKIRRDLEENGARFVLCFFDENSVNRWNVFASDAEASYDYEYLLRWLLEDSSLGIVFKPKKSSDLFHRIERVSDLIEKGKATGRCRFMGSDDFPAEAALGADVCIGKLLGATAALDARLVGIPTVLIDIERFCGYPFRSWREGSVVFRDWDSLRQAIEKYRSSPDDYWEFGMWEPGLEELDPFQDGEGGLRIGRTISWLWESLNAGNSKDDALSIMRKKFSERWGAMHIMIR